MRRTAMAIVAGFASLLLASCGGGGTTTPLTPVGYLVAIKTGPPIFAFVGAPVPIAFTVTEVESDSTTRPASGKQFTVSVTRGGGTVNGASTTTLTTANDGTVAFTWLLGTTTGGQDLRGAIGDRSASVNMTAFPLPVSAVQVNMPDSVVQLFAQVEASAVLRDSLGRTVGHSAPDVRGASFTSSNPLVATVPADFSPFGNIVITTVGLGTTVITATSEGKSGSALLRVVAP